MTIVLSDQLVSTGPAILLQDWGNLAYGHGFSADAARLNDGRSILVYNGPSQVAASTEITAQIFDASGNALGDRFIVNTFLNANQTSPDVAALSDGGFVVTWVSRTQDGYGEGVFAQRFDASGQRIGGEIQISSDAPYDQNDPHVTGQPGGGFAVAWASQPIGYFTRAFNASGQPLGAETRINPHADLQSQLYDAIPTAGGGYDVIWRVVGLGAINGVFKSHYTAEGTPVGQTRVVDNINGFYDDLELDSFQLADGQVLQRFVARLGSHDGSAAFARLLSDGSFDFGTATAYPTATRIYQHTPYAIDPLAQDIVFISAGPGLVRAFYGHDSYSWDGTSDPPSTGLYTELLRLNQPARGEVALTGTAAIGEVLGFTTALTDTDGMGSLSYQWRLGNVDLVGETGNTLLVTEDMRGGRVNVVVSFTDGAGFQEHVASDPSVPVTDAGRLLEGDDGANFLQGAAGSDRLIGHGGNDTLLGEADNDQLFGGDGADRLNGGDGNDRLFGGASAADLGDTVFGGAGDDYIDTGYGNDNVSAGLGSDTVIGGFGSDTLVGQEGNDFLTGSALSDQLFGNDGFDFLNGGFGHDRLNGGAGDDRFYHLGVRDHGSDWIQDYSALQGDQLAIGIRNASPSQFQINRAATPGAGLANVDELFIIYKPTQQILWALVDGAAQSRVYLMIEVDGTNNFYTLLT